MLLYTNTAIKSHKISYEKAISISGFRRGWGYIMYIFVIYFLLINIHFMRKYFKMKFHEIRVMSYVSCVYYTLGEMIYAPGITGMRLLKKREKKIILNK